MNRSARSLAIALLASELIASCGGSATTGTNTSSPAAMPALAQAPGTYTAASGVVTGGLMTGMGAGSTDVTTTVGAVSGTGQVTVSTNFWTTAGSMAVGLVNHSAVALSNGKALVAGGMILNPTDGTGTIVASAQTYDPAANTWSSTASMATARYSFAAVRLSNGNVLAIGGVGNPNPTPDPVLSSAEIYNPTSGQWSSGGTMTSTRFGHTATVLANGKVLVTGGAIDDLGPNLLITGILASAEVYDPATNTWSPAASMSNPRYLHTATLLANGKVLVAGGMDLSTNTLASAEIYDPVADAWSPAGALNAARSEHSAALLSNGKVLIAGDLAPGSTNQATTSAEVYDPSSNTWTVTGSLTDARARFSAVTLTDGTVLVAAGGGAPPGTILSSAEIFNPSNSTWTPTLSLSIGRIDSTLTLLPDGSVLAAGGANASSLGSLSSC